MERESERWPEGTFDILWFQHNPDDWMAEITDRQSGQKRRVHSLDELLLFVQARLLDDAVPSAEP